MALQQGGFSKPFVAHFCAWFGVLKMFDTSGIKRIAASSRNYRSPRGEIRGGLFLWSFRNRTAATSRRHISHARRLSVVSAPPSEPFRSKLISRCARTCRHAAWPEPRPHAAPAAKG